MNRPAHSTPEASVLNPVPAERSPWGYLARAILLGAVAVLTASPRAPAQPPSAILYEGDVVPAMAVPPWISGGDVTAGLVVADANAEDGSAYDLPTTGSGGWAASSSDLLSLDNATGWVLEIGHQAIFNQFEDMERKFTNDDTDHVRISDGSLNVRVSFRPGQVRIDSGRTASWLCSEIPDQCRLFSVPVGDYVAVRIVARGSSYTATVNGQQFVGLRDRVIPKILFFGNASGSADSHARWDYVRLFMAETDSDGDGVSDEVDVCPATVIAESVPTRRLGVNRFALVDDDNAFDTSTPRGGGPGVGFTIEDTSGCSCEQIIVALGLGRGHEKFGCSISAMETWVALVSP